MFRVLRNSSFLVSPNMFHIGPHPWVSHYAGPEPDIKEICQQFASYEGGSIELLKEEESGIATITLRNDDRRNALSGKMMVDLHDIVCDLETWQNGKGVILHSFGQMFCSGGDLTTVKQISNPDDGFKMSCLMHNNLTRLHQLPLVSVAVVHGKAIGGGAELTTSCDFRLLTPSAEISFVQGRMGVVTGWGGGSRLVQLLGQHKALDLLLTSKKVGATEALDLGLSNGTLSTDNILEAVQEAKIWLQERLVHKAQIVHALKNIVATARAIPFEESLNNERRVFAKLWGGEANKEALQQNIKHK